MQAGPISQRIAKRAYWILRREGRTPGRMPRRSTRPVGMLRLGPIAIVLLTVSLLLVGCSRSGSVAGHLTPETLARFESTLEILREESRIPAISAAIVHDGALVWSQGFGVSNLDLQTEATAQTPYGLASLTKPFSAFLVMKLVEQGLLDLDAPIKNLGIDLGNDRITTRHLLSHTSEGAAGSGYRYSGTRYAYLTRIIEQLYGAPYRRVLRQEILEPLGMTDTALNIGGCGLEYYLSTLTPDDPERVFAHVYERLATPYQYDPDYELYPVPVPTYANAAAGLISTAEDLAKLAIAIDQDELVDADTKAAMFTPMRLTTGDDGPHGLGWFTETYRGSKLIWHFGNGAYSSLFLMMPDEGLTFIVLGNTQNLSRPFGLGWGDVSVLISPFALEFYKEFVLQPGYGTPLPEIDWTADEDAVVEQLEKITDARLRELYENELWSYRKLHAGVGRYTLAHALLNVHTRAFPDADQSTRDLYEARRPTEQPSRQERVELTEGDAARWTGTFRIRPADTESGLPTEVEVRVLDGRVLAIPSDGSCQEYYPLGPTRLVASDSPDILLVGALEDEPFDSFEIRVSGQTVATYERIR
jgi:CubicO group peptidase (beta-lactamase class C family)